MPKLIRVYDPDEPERRINLVIAEANCPGLLEFLAEMPYRTETPLIRGVLYQWYLKHRDAGTLGEAIQEALEGSGGLIEAAPQDKQVRRGAKGRSAKAVKPRAIYARPAARPSTLNPEQEAPPVQQPLSQGVVASPPTPMREAPPQSTQDGTIAASPGALPADRPDANPGEIAADTASTLSTAEVDPDALAALDKLGEMFG